MQPQREDFVIEVQVEREDIGIKAMVMIMSGEQAVVAAHQLPTSTTKKPASIIWNMRSIERSLLLLNFLFDLDTKKLYCS